MFHLKPAFTSGAMVEDSIYFSDSFINAFYAANVSTGECRYIGKFPEESDRNHLLHCGVFSYKNEIVFAPGRGHHVHVYDISSGEIRIVGSYGEQALNHRIGKSLLRGNELWLFPLLQSFPILSIDITSNSCNAYGSWAENVRLSDGKAELNYVVSGEKVYAAVNGGSSLMDFNLDTKEFNTRELPIKGIYYMYSIDKDFWICTEDGIYRILGDGAGIMGCDMEESITGPVLFFGANDSSVYTASSIGGPLLTLEGSRFVKKMDFSLERAPTFSYGYMYGSYIDIDGGILIFPPYGKDSTIIKNGKARKLILDVQNKEDIEFSRKSVFLTGGEELLYESGPIAIGDFLTIINQV